MNREKTKTGGFVLVLSRPTAGMANSWAGLIGIMLFCTSAYVASADNNRVRKVHNPAADAKACTKLIEGSSRRGAVELSGHWQFVNNCPSAVEFFWCSDAECTRDSGNTWTISAGRGWPVSGTNVRWGACRGANSGSFDKGSQGTKYTCPNLTW
jgi:hypothetical protein